jgi:hypothetical protein
MTKVSGSGKNFRSASTGRFVKPAYAKSHPKSTLGETRGGGGTQGAHRSAVTGKFVTKSAARRSPSTTIEDS